MPELESIDFKAILADLRNAGLTHYKIGLMLGYQGKSVDHLAKCGNPKWSVALKLLQCHRELR